MTADQRQRLIEFREEWRTIGLTSGPVNRMVVKAVFDEMYGAVGRKPVPLIVLPSPASALITFPALKILLKDQLGDQLGGQLRDQLGFQTYDGLAGHCEAYWIAFYRFPEQIGCTYTRTVQHHLAWWDTLARHCGWWWPYEKVIIACDRPITRWNAAYQLHAEDGPAIEFPDGYSLWALNGVRVPKQLVITADHDLDPREWVLQQSNAEIRREAVRKIGIERVCAQLHAQILDRRDNYELLTLNLGDQRKRPYLKMVNPSTGTYHIEGVPSNITTVQEALTWRNRTDQTPKILT